MFILSNDSLVILGIYTIYYRQGVRECVQNWCDGSREKLDQYNGDEKLSNSNNNNNNLMDMLPLNCTLGVQYQQTTVSPASTTVLLKSYISFPQRNNGSNSNHNHSNNSKETKEGIEFGRIEYNTATKTLSLSNSNVSLAR